MTSQQHMLADLDFSSLLDFLNYGAAGVMALAFVVVLFLFWKKDKQVDELFSALKERDDRLEDDGGRLDSMIEVVKQNTEAMTSVRMAVDHNTEAMTRLNTDLDKKLEDLDRDMREIRQKL